MDSWALGIYCQVSRTWFRSNLCGVFTAEQSVPDGMPRDILKTEVKAATRALGISPGKLIIFNYEVRKLNYVRQEILESLIKIRRDKNLDLVLMPSLKDIHQDHTTIAQEGLRTFKNTTILGYELIWNNLSFDTTSFAKMAGMLFLTQYDWACEERTLFNFYEKSLEVRNDKKSILDN